MSEVRHWLGEDLEAARAQVDDLERFRDAHNGGGGGGGWEMPPPTQHDTEMYAPLPSQVGGTQGAGGTQVGRCRLTVSKPVLKVRMVSAIEAIM
jgi:hypothetical protein